MLLQLLCIFPFNLIHHLLYKITITFTLLSLLYIILYHIGIIQRLLQIYMEHQISLIANGAQISISDIEFQLLNYTSLQSTIILHDSIIHTPQVQKWKWESPLIARIGYARVTFNLLSVIDLPPDWKENLGIRIRSVKDIYTVELRDVQVFVEKRRNVFNFHLLDDRLDIPNAEEVWRSLVGGSSSGGGVGGGREDRLDIPLPGFVDRSSSAASSMTVLASGGGGGAGTGGGSQEDREEENALQAEDVKKADELVTSIVQAVSSLGRAANEGGTKGLSNALKNQKDGFVNHLRKVQNMVALGSCEKDSTTTLSSSTAATTAAAAATTAAEQNSMISSSNKEKKQNKSIGIAKEGIQVMKQVGKVVEKNVLNMKEQVDALSKPPPFRKDWKPMEYPDLFRFGYIILKDARIFTKDIIIVPGADEKTSDKDEVSSCDFTSTSAKGWSKPIAIKEVRLFPSELCPPKDKENASTIGQPIEVYSNLALERVFTEMATSSISGKLLNNAFTDVFKLFDIANRAE